LSVVPSDPPTNKALVSFPVAPRAYLVIDKSPNSMAFPKDAVVIESIIDNPNETF